MTIPKFNPRFTNEKHWSCASVDKTSPWCLAISDCIWKYESRFNDIQCYIKVCYWPMNEQQFKLPYNKPYRNGFETYKDYISSNPKVDYEYEEDCCFYGLKTTDGTLTFAYQNDEYIFIIHIASYYIHPYEYGFGCVINKLTNELHFVALGEDDGNYWGDHDLSSDKLRDYDIAIVSSIVNDFQEDQLYDKEALLFNLFQLAKAC